MPLSLERARLDNPRVAQVSKPAVSPTSKSAPRWKSPGLRVPKPATQQTWKSALQPRRPFQHRLGGSLALPELTLVVALIISVVPGFAHAQVQQAWVARYNDNRPSSTNQTVALAIAPDGNIVIGGSSTSTNGDYDYITLKYSPSGTVLWSSRHASPGTANDQVRAMKMDVDGHVFVTGTAVTIKYSSSGAPIWAVPYGGRDLALDTNGNCYITGFSETDWATAKLTADGSNVWVRTYDRRGKTDISQKIALGTSGAVYVAGREEWYCDRRGCSSELVMIKYDQDGGQLWTNIFYPGVLGSSSEIRSFATDGDGNVYILGLVLGAYNAVFLHKFTSGGQRIWAESFDCCQEGPVAMAVGLTGAASLTGGDTRYYDLFQDVLWQTYSLGPTGSIVWQVDYPATQAAHSPRFEGYHRGKAIATRGANDVYVTGESTLGYEPYHIVTIKYGANGREFWTAHYNSFTNGNDQGQAIAVDGAGNIYVAGRSHNEQGGTDIILIKYVEAPQIQMLANQSVLLQFAGTPGQAYRFETSTNLSNWFEIGSSLADSNCLYRFMDTNAPAAPGRFYRSVSP